MYSRDGAENDVFVVGAGNFRACAMGEEASIWRNKSTIGAPEIVYYWRHDAAVHVAGDEEIEFIELGGDLGVRKVDGGMDEGDFSFVFWKIGNEFLV